MGCDGGSFPRRSELVSLKPEVKKLNTTTTRYTVDHLTNLPLTDKISIDRLGNLYNTESAITSLLKGEKWKAVQKRKDLKELKGRECPILKGRIMNGTYPFIALWNCGCVMSEKGRKEVGGKECFVVRTYKGLSRDQRTKVTLS